MWWIVWSVGPGTKTNPLPFESVLRQIADVLERYGVNTAIGDQHCGDVIKETSMKFGIFYEICNFGTSTRPKIFSNLKHLLAQGKIRLPDNADLLRQLRNLRDEKTPDGRIDVQSTSGMKDDKAVTLPLAANEICRPDVTASPVGIGGDKVRRRFRALHPWQLPGRGGVCKLPNMPGQELLFKL